MEKESLKKARNVILTALVNSNINLQDKTELIINISNLLDEAYYDGDIKSLQKKRHEDKYRNMR